LTSAQAQSRPVIILGVDRSGTSIVARLAHEWGVYGGNPAELERRDPFNPSGYWELRPMVLLLHEVFKETGRDFWRPGFEEALRNAAANPRLRKAADDLVASMAADGRAVWFWKEPWLSLQLPFWKQIWGDASYIITVRNPYDSAVSWEKMMLPRDVRGRISIIALNLLRWQHFMLSILRGVEGSRRLLFVPYEELVKDPRGQSERICRFLDQETGTAHDEGRVERMLKAVDPGLWRNKSETDFSQIEIATREQKAFYDLLRRKVDDPYTPFNLDEYALYPGWREYLQNFAEFEAFYATVNKLLRSRPVRFILAVNRRFAFLRRPAKS
jgi:hypothetical protein